MSDNLNTKIKVSAVSAKTYDQTEIDNAVVEMLNQLGGIEKFVPQNGLVLLKANLVRDMSPEMAGTTHPTVLIALANEIAKKTKATVVVGDSSGGAYTTGAMNAVYRKCQMTAVEQNCKATLNQNFEFQSVNLNGKVLHNTDIIDIFFKADVVINVTKLKSHGFTGYTGAVKNLFGLIAGFVKVEMHSRFPELNDFLDLLIDIEQFAKDKVVLHVIDAVVAMEGNGPTNGQPKFVGKIMASQNPYLLDFVATSLICDPLKTPLLEKAVERDLLDLEQLDFDLESWKEEYIEDFDVIEVLTSNSFLKLPKWLQRLLKENINKKVKILKHCKACGKCKTHCPRDAITIAKRAKVDQSKCIRCFCCQELCPFDAVKLKKPIVYRVVQRFSHSKDRNK